MNSAPIIAKSVNAGLMMMEVIGVGDAINRRQLMYAKKPVPWTGNAEQLNDDGAWDLCVEIMKGFISEYKEAIKKDSILHTQNSRGDVYRCERILEHPFYQALFAAVNVDAESVKYNMERRYRHLEGEHYGR